MLQRLNLFGLGSSNLCNVTMFLTRSSRSIGLQPKHAHSVLPGNLEIVDGMNATEGEFPYMISLRFYNEQDCGGSIIGDQWILTAGHCVSSIVDGAKPILENHQLNTALSSLTNNDRGLWKKSDIAEVQFGKIEIDNYHYDKNHTRFIKNVFLHPDYDFMLVNMTLIGIRNDIAILELNETLPFGKNVTSVKLPEQDESPPINRTGVFTGWGYTDTDGRVPDILLKVNLTIFPEKYCQEASNGFYQNNGSNICAGSLKAHRGVCSGDSGGPLVVDGVQWGVLSWMIPPCGNYMSGYSRLSFYRNWITNITGI